MRLLMVMLLTLSLTFMGCAASDQKVQSYHDNIRITNLQIVESVNKQSAEIRAADRASMVYFSQAMTEAAKTADPSDNAVIAFAWGFVSAQPKSIEVPSLQYPRAPVTDVDRVKAWTPIVGMAVPLVTPLLYGYGAFGSSGDGSTQDIVATDNATIYLDSGNTNSQNAVRGGSTFDGSNANTTNQHDDYSGEGTGLSASPVSAEGECAEGMIYRDSTGTCITPACEAAIAAGEGDSCDGGVTPVVTPVSGGDITLQECLANPPGGFKGSTPMYTATNSCRSSGLSLATAEPL